MSALADALRIGCCQLGGFQFLVWRDDDSLMKRLPEQSRFSGCIELAASAISTVETSLLPSRFTERTQ